MFLPLTWLQINNQQQLWVNGSRTITTSPFFGLVRSILPYQLYTLVSTGRAAHSPGSKPSHPEKLGSKQDWTEWETGRLAVEELCGQADCVISF